MTAERAVVGSSSMPLGGSTLAPLGADAITGKLAAASLLDLLGLSEVDVGKLHDEGTVAGPGL